MLLAESALAGGDYGPVWVLVSILLGAIGSLWGIGELRRSRQEKREEARKDRIVDIDEKFKDKMATQFDQMTDILGGQANTLKVMAETQKRQGELIDDLHKLSKEWDIFKKFTPNVTVKMPDSGDHLHIEQPQKPS